MVMIDIHLRVCYVRDVVILVHLVIAKKKNVKSKTV